MKVIASLLVAALVAYLALEIAENWETIIAVAKVVAMCAVALGAILLSLAVLGAFLELVSKESAPQGAAGLGAAAGKPAAGKSAAGGSAKEARVRQPVEETESGFIRFK